MAYFSRGLNPNSDAIIGGYGTDLNAIVGRAAAARWRSGVFGNTSAFDAPVGIPYVPSLGELSQIAHVIYADVFGRFLSPPLVVHLWITLGLSLVGIAAWRLALAINLPNGLALGTGILCQVLPQTLSISAYQATFAHSWVPLMTIVTFVHTIRHPARRTYLLFGGSLTLCIMFEYYWSVFALIPIIGLILARAFTSNSRAVKLATAAGVLSGLAFFHRVMVILVDRVASRRTGLGFPDPLMKIYGPEFFIPRSQLVTPPADHIVGSIIRVLPGNIPWNFSGGFWIGGLTLILIPFGVKWLISTRATRWFLAVAVTYLLVSIPPFYIEVLGQTIFMPSGWFSNTFPRFRAPYRAVLIWAPMAMVIAVAGLHHLRNITLKHPGRFRRRILRPALIIPLMFIDVVGTDFRATVDPDSIVFARVNDVLHEDGAQRILSFTSRVYGFENIIGGRDSTLRNLNYHAQFGANAFLDYLAAKGVTHIVTASSEMSLYPGAPWFSPTVELKFNRLGATLVERVEWFQGGSPDQEMLYVDIWRLSDSRGPGKLMCNDCGGLYVDTDGPTAAVTRNGVVPLAGNVDVVWEDKLKLSDRAWKLTLRIRRTDGVHISTAHVVTEGSEATVRIGLLPVDVTLDVPRSGRASISLDGTCSECLVIERINFVDS